VAGRIRIAVKQQNLYAELRGTTTSDTPVRREHSQNWWAILTAATPDMEQAGSKLSATIVAPGLSATTASASARRAQSPASPSAKATSANAEEKKTAVAASSDGSPNTNTWNAIRSRLTAKGASALQSLSRFYRLVDTRRTGIVSKDEFLTALRTLRLIDALTPPQIRSMLAELDGGTTSTIPAPPVSSIPSVTAATVNYPNFFNIIRGTPNARRQSVVAKAFAKLDPSHQGTVTAADLGQKFDASSHPAVRTRQKTTSQVIREFVANFQGYGGNSSIVADDLQDYYANVGSFIDSDDVFCAIVCSTWHVAE